MIFFFLSGAVLTTTVAAAVDPTRTWSLHPSKTKQNTSKLHLNSALSRHQEREPRSED